MGDVGRIKYGEEAGDGVRRRLDAKMNLGTGMENYLGLKLWMELGGGMWMASGMGNGVSDCQLALGMDSIPVS